MFARALPAVHQLQVNMERMRQRVTQLRHASEERLQELRLASGAMVGTVVGRAALMGSSMLAQREPSPHATRRSDSRQASPPPRARTPSPPLASSSERPFRPPAEAVRAARSSIELPQAPA
jgi:hypothetical protein